MRMSARRWAGGEGQVSQGSGGMTFGQGFRPGCMTALVYNALKNPGALLACGCIVLVFALLAGIVLAVAAWQLRWWLTAFVAAMAGLRYLAIPWWNRRHPRMQIRPTWPKWFWDDSPR